MRTQLKQPFEYLKRKDGTAFAPEIIKHWYEARAYVLNKLKSVTINPDSRKHLHVIFKGDSPQMLAAVRQIALTAHYPNYDESTGQNRTLVTIVSGNKQLWDELKKEEYLCNLVDNNNNLFIDIEFQIGEDWQEGKNEHILILSDEDMASFLGSKNEKEVYYIDTTRAASTNMVYQIGAEIDNLPAEDIHNPNRYQMALDVFRRILRNKTPLIDETKWESDQIEVKNGLSNIFCSDCFEFKSEQIIKANIEAFSKSEHARWVTEKLIMGFRSLNKEERIHDERLFGDKKKQYRKQLKSNPSDPVHIDLCSYADLRRINPDDLKYDSFLMLAIPIIKR